MSKEEKEEIFDLPDKIIDQYIKDQPKVDALGKLRNVSLLKKDDTEDPVYYIDIFYYQDPKITLKTMEDPDKPLLYGTMLTVAEATKNNLYEKIRKVMKNMEKKKVPPTYFRVREKSQPIYITPHTDPNNMDTFDSEARKIKVNAERRYDEKEKNEILEAQKQFKKDSDFEIKSLDPNSMEYYIKLKSQIDNQESAIEHAESSYERNMKDMKDCLKRYKKELEKADDKNPKYKKNWKQEAKKLGLILQNKE
jgi:hypothetical protein